MNRIRTILRFASFILVALTLTSCTANARKERALKRADKYFEAGEYEKAKIEYMNVLRVEGENPRAIQQLGLVYYEQGVAVRAIPFLRKSTDISADSIVSRAKLAAALFSLGDLPRAREEAAKVVEREPGHEEALILMADTARTDEERAATEELLKKVPENAPGRHLAAATLAAKKGSLPEAEKHVRRAIELAPKSPTGHIALGNVLMMQKQMDAAEKEFRTAANLSPLRSPAKMKLAEFEMQTAKPDEAKRILEEVTKGAPDFLPAYRLRTRVALTEQKWDEALAVVEKGLSNDPEDFDLRLFQAEAWTSKGETKKGVEALERLPERFRDWPFVKLRLARAYVLDRNDSAALEALEQALAKQPDFVEAVLLKGELELRAGRPQVVVASMSELLNRRGDIPQAKLLLAQAREAVGQFAEAEAIYREQLAHAADNAPLHLLLGRVLNRQKKTDEARAAFEKARELAPDNIVVLSQLVGLDLAAGNVTAAVSKTDEAIAKNPSSGSAYLLKGRIYFSQRNWEQAIAALNKAIELDSTLSSAYETLIATYIASNRTEEALSQLEALLRKNPTQLQAIVLAGLLHQSRGEHAKALEMYERAIAVNGDTVPALNNAAYLHAEGGNALDRALELARKARALQPTDPSIADTLGWILYKRKEYPQALALIQEAAKDIGDNAEVQFHLGMVAYAIGETEISKAALKRAADSPGTFPGKDQITPRLAFLDSLTDPTKKLSRQDLEHLLAQEPNDPLIQTRLGAAYEAEGQAEKAIATYEAALKTNPSSTVTLLRLADLIAAIDPQKAFSFAKSARELIPADDAIAATAARVAIRTGNSTWAYNVLGEVSRRAAPKAEVIHDLALAAYALSKPEEADEAMKRVVRDFPDSPEAKEAQDFLAVTAFDRNPEAIQFPQAQVDRRLTKNKVDLPALMARGTNEAKSDPAAATATLTSILKIAPDFAPAQFRLAEIYGTDPKKLAEAYDLAAKARRTMPNDPAVTRVFGELSSKRGEHAFAVELLKASAQKLPLSPTSLFYLGRSQLQSGQVAEGKLSLQRALAAGLSAPLSAEVEKMLAEADGGGTKK